MERLETKSIKGQTYYYYSKWERVKTKNGSKCRRVWQKYLGKLENIVKAVEGMKLAPKYAEVFQWGLPTALWQECIKAKVIEETNKKCSKRTQGMTIGEYIAIAAINRAIFPKSKNSMWEWFSQTTLLRYLPHANKRALTSQRFWDHMDKINQETTHSIWESLIINTIKEEKVDLSSVSYDGTNFYTFIDTFNTRCDIAKRGKNKQGRNNLRQISYALFCTSDNHIPLLYEVYEGNLHDAKQFPKMLLKFNKFFNKLAGGNAAPNVTLIFDKGNNSQENMEMLNSLPVHFVGSVKLSEHEDLANIPNDDERFKVCPKFNGTKAFRTKKKVYGIERTLLITYNENLFQSQIKTVHNDINKVMSEMSKVKQNLVDRANGVIRGGRTPTETSVKAKCKKILSRQHMKQLISTNVEENSEGYIMLDYSIDTKALQELSETHLGKNILITDKEDWDDTQIITGYRSQYLIEDVFKEMKDRERGEWWPLYHWTPSKIHVHGLYCTIAVLIRALMMRRLETKGVKMSMKRVLDELDTIREVVNIYSARGKGKSRQSVLTKASEVQERLMSALELTWRGDSG